MRRILVDKARERRAVKRGGGQRPLSLDQLRGQHPANAGPGNLFANLEALDNALDKLGAEARHQRKVRIVELRYFVGLTTDQTAEALDVSPATVKRDWEFTRAWLWERMKGTRRDDP
jgi:RNA polymerase sigma factor (TIGR02999 family)